MAFNSPHIPMMKAAAAAGNGLLTNLVSYWTLDEVSGTRADSHGAFNLSESGPVGSVAGALGNAADFSSGNVDLVNYSAKMTAGDPMAVSFWVWRASASSSLHALSENSSEFLVRESGTKLEFILNSFTTNDRLSSVSDIPAGEWVHVVLQYTGTDLEIWVNGTLDNSVTPTGSHVCDGGVERIGSWKGSTWFDSFVDEVGLWSSSTFTGLSSAQVQALYGSGTPLAYASFTS